jgi:hypothetical protein
MNSITGPRYARLEYDGLRKLICMHLLDDMNIHIITELHKNGLLNPANCEKPLYNLEQHITNVRKKYKVELLKHIIETQE